MSDAVPANVAIKGVDIGRLTHPISPTAMRNLVALDRALVDELGARFSNERWSERQFAMKRPGKLEFSRVAHSTESSRIVGYWIASLRSPEHLHTHRVGVEVTSRGSGIGTALCSAVMGEATTRLIRVLTISVQESNEAARRFYCSLGFAPLVGDSLEKFALPKGVGRVGGHRDRLVVDGCRYVVLHSRGSEE